MCSGVRAGAKFSCRLAVWSVWERRQKNRLRMEYVMNCRFMGLKVSKRAVPAALGVLLMGLGGSSLAADLEFYLDRLSVEPGSSLNLHTSVANADDIYRVEVYREGAGHEYVWDDSLVNTEAPNGYIGAVYPLPEATPWSEPLAWGDGVAIPAGEDIDSGFYSIQVTSLGVKQSSLFVVKPAAGIDSGNRVLLLDNAAFNVASNSFGGKSLLDFNSTGGAAEQVAIDRPMGVSDGTRQLKLAAWMEHAGIGYDALSMFDIESSGSIPTGYEVVVLSGESAYWSLRMRNAIDSFVSNGGNLVILGGRTMDLNVSVNQGKMGLEGKWSEATPPLLANSITGQSYENGGFVNALGHLQSTSSNDNGAYSVSNDNHWIYTGTALKSGDTFGKTAAIVGPKVDSAPLQLVDGKAQLLGSDGITPEGLELLAWAEAYNEAADDKKGFASMSLFQRSGGGWVFNAGTVGWADGLWRFGDDTTEAGVADEQVSKLTKNVLDVFLSDQSDSDSDGTPDVVDAFPDDAAKSFDSDSDGVDDKIDDLPLDPNEQIDTDQDGIGNNADPDDDGDGYPDSADAFPLDASESSDYDGDGVGDNADTDADGDGVADVDDAYPLDETRSQSPEPAAKSSGGGSFGLILLLGLISFRWVFSLVGERSVRDSTH